MKIRAFRADDKDYAARERLANLQYPDDPFSLTEMRHADPTRNNVWWRQLIVEKNGEVVDFGAIGQAFWTNNPDKYLVEVDVDPACLGQGIGFSVFNRLVEMAQTDNHVSILTAKCREDLEAAVAFLTDRGFRIDIRNASSSMEFATFDDKPFGRLIEGVEEKGICIRSLQSLSQLPDWQERYWRLSEEILHDVPAPEPYRKRALPLFVQEEVEVPHFAPDINHIALSGTNWVGMSEVRLDPERPEFCSSGLTGVSREWRRMGIATALKVSVLRVAWERGLKRLNTANEENNPMLQINLALGFKPLPTWLGWSLALESKS